MDEAERAKRRKRATKEEQAEREQMAVSLLQAGLRPYRACTGLMEKYGLSRQQANVYVRRARDSVNLDEAANRSIAYLIGVVEDTKAEPAARRDAARTLAKIGKPQRVQHGGDPDSQPIQIDTARGLRAAITDPDQMDALIRNRAEYQQASEGSENGNGKH